MIYSKVFSWALQSIEVQSIELNWSEQNQVRNEDYSLLDLSYLDVSFIRFIFQCKQYKMYLRGQTKLTSSASCRPVATAPPQCQPTCFPGNHIKSLANQNSETELIAIL